MDKTQEVLLIKYGEIALRGGNRRIYENMLMDAIRKNLENAGFEGFHFYKEQGRFVVAGGDMEKPLSGAIAHIVCVFGITSVCRGVRLAERSVESLFDAALGYAKENIGNSATFKVTTNRADKNFPGKSNEISAELGGHILTSFPELKVKLEKPDFELIVEIRNSIYIYSKATEVEGPGGLPPGSAGKGVLLLSGGIDSPVAGYLAAKRGIDLTAIYFHSPPYTSERAKEKVLDIAKQLSHHTGKIKVIVVNFTEIQLYLNDKTPPAKITLMLKRAMLKMAGITAQSEKGLAIITGDAVGQVASQTLHSLHAMTGATDLPILRPLATYDKKDIVGLAQKIGTFDISIRPFDDCCTLFLPKNPETKPKLSIIQNIERKMDDLEHLMSTALEQAEIYQF
ncbi:MAG: tRNA 4-thiouridine(8) synthase ThiI [Defluviitaleaceae bacterium]|nr:tRNA 4-thiouridine(8) synthase ThiI [Defluviitaleaceae bacterium]